MSNLEQDATKAAADVKAKAVGWWSQPVETSKTTFIILCLALFIVGAIVGHFG